MAYNRDYGQGPIDASFGLIYRLNQLWQRVDVPAMNGDFDKWNFTLDRIFCNLLYKEDFEQVRDTEGNLIEVKLSGNDQEIWNYLNKKFLLARKKLKLAIKNRDLNAIQLAKSELYNALMFKDIGLRKFMFQLKLYMKASDSNPSKAMWGG